MSVVSLRHSRSGPELGCAEMSADPDTIDRLVRLAERLVRDTGQPVSAFRVDGSGHLYGAPMFRLAPEDMGG